MKKLLCVLSILLAGACEARQESPDDGITPPTPPSPLTDFREVTITGVGLTARAIGHTMPECAAFTLSDDEVRAYFREARQVTHGVYSHMLDWSPCYVKGTITLQNGETARWDIDQFRAGSVVLKSGESIYLFCQKCRGKAFAPADE